MTIFEKYVNDIFDFYQKKGNHFSDNEKKYLKKYLFSDLILRAVCPGHVFTGYKTYIRYNIILKDNTIIGCRGIPCESCWNIVINGISEKDDFLELYDKAQEQLNNDIL